MNERVVIGDAVLYHGDCRDVLPTLADNCANSVISDPPYEQEAHTKGRRGWSGKSSSKFGKGIAMERPLGFAQMDEETRSDVAHHIYRLSTGWGLVFCQVEAVHIWRELLEQAGAKYLRTQMWDREDAAPQFTGDRPAMAFECIVSVWCGEGRSKWNGGGRRGTYRHPTVKRDRVHTTQKPLPLMADLVSLFSNSRETILDPFMGSGTTGVAALQLGRKFTGIEREPKYFDIACRRIEEASKQADFFIQKPTKQEQAGLGI